jgi:site-specific DNA-methyltransferase (adenine-specific)
VYTCTYLTPGQSTQVFGRRVKANWKLVVILTKDKNTLEHFRDTFSGARNDKRYHKWGQCSLGMRQIVERFTVPGMPLCDPFCGASTSGVAARLANRLYSGADSDNASIQQSALRLKEIEADAE